MAISMQEIIWLQVGILFYSIFSLGRYLLFTKLNFFKKKKKTRVGLLSPSLKNCLLDWRNYSFIIGLYFALYHDELLPSNLWTFNQLALLTWPAWVGQESQPHLARRLFSKFNYRTETKPQCVQFHLTLVLELCMIKHRIHGMLCFWEEKYKLDSQFCFCLKQKNNRNRVWSQELWLPSQSHHFVLCSTAGPRANHLRKHLFFKVSSFALSMPLPIIPLPSISLPVIPCQPLMLFLDLQNNKWNKSFIPSLLLDRRLEFCSYKGQGLGPRCAKTSPL